MGGAEPRGSPLSRSLAQLGPRPARPVQVRLVGYYGHRRKDAGPPDHRAATEAAIRKALKKGDTGIKIATTLGVGMGTVQRIRAEMSV